MHVVEDANALINGGFIAGRSPRDGAPLPRLPVSAPDQVLRVVAQAREAQHAWAEVPAKERARRIKKLAGSMLARAEALADIMAREQGKSTVESYTSELVPSADLFAYWASEAPRLLRPRAQRLNPINFPGKRGVLELTPLGVVGLITPWNYPVSLPLRSLVPALAAGNAVVWKPSEYAPRIGAALAELFDELRVPGLVGVVQGAGDVGAQIIDAEVDHLVFIGSVSSGRKVAERCADRLTSYNLELGGKDAALVLADCDLERAVEGIVWGAFANAGQNCAAIERVYVVEPIAARFIERVVERTRALRIGDGKSTDYDVGPLVRPAGLETVRRHVDDAVKHGATLRIGGKPTGVGLHFEPTILTDVDDDMAVMVEETFGPVMPVVVVRDAEEAIARANRSVYGLTASIWSRDLHRAQALAPRLRVGVVTINNHSFTAALPHAPWHGRGQSGGGVTNSPLAFYDLVQPRYVLTDKNRSRELWWFPHNPAMTRIARAFAVLLGRGGNKVRALVTALSNLPKRWK